MALKKIPDKIVVNDIPKNEIFRTIAIGSGKGGVGKSTIAANLAMEMASQGKKVGLIDADIYGPTQPKMFGCEQTLAETQNDKIIPLEVYGVKFISIASLLDTSKPLILRAPMVIKIINSLLHDVIWGELDYLLIDLPPGTGDIQLTIAQIAKLDGAIIVTTPQEVAINIAQKGLEMFQKVNVPILGIVENMSSFTCEHCNKVTHIFSKLDPAAKQNVVNFAAKYNLPVLAQIPLQANIAAAGDQGIAATKANASLSAIFYDLAKSCYTLLDSNLKSNLIPEVCEIDNDKLHVAWNQQQIDTSLDAHKLRLACECALCVDENSGKPKLTSTTIPAEITITDIAATGRYGVKIKFSDGHSTGIYTYQMLLHLAKSKNQ